MFSGLAASHSQFGEYRIEGEVGRGGMSVVYRASKGLKSYAIKVMARTQASLTAEARVRVRREAAAVARLRHPSLVQIVEVGEIEGTPYIVMEFAEGDGLDTLIETRPLSEERTVQVARAIGSALVEVHRFGLVHRDIKPKNIVIHGFETIKLIDFGLVQQQGEQDGVAGTLTYAAPEQLRIIHANVDGRADLYALGVTLFECLTGVPPIRGATESEFLERLATRDAPDVRDLRPEVRPALAAIVRKLLSKDPDDRYQSARSLCADLAELPRLEQAVREGLPLELGSLDKQIWVQDELPMVGRKLEVETLRKAWEDARRQHGSLLLLEGEGGSGKTRLVREFLLNVQADSHPVLAGKCQEFDTVPFGALREAVDGYLARVQSRPPSEREKCLEQIRLAAGELSASLARLSPSLSATLGNPRDTVAPDPDTGRLLFYEAIASFLAGMAEVHGGAILVLDDIQWLDEGSLHVMQRVAVKLSGASLLVLSMARNDAMSEVRRGRFVEQVGSSTQVKRLVLESLTEQEVGQLISGHLGGGLLTEPATRRLTAISRGNPFHVAEYVRALLEQGLLQPMAGGWDVDLQSLSEVNLPPDVIQLVVNRMRSLNERTGWTLAVAGLLGMRFSAQVLAMATQAAPEELQRALEESIRNNLLERTGLGTYAFVHDRVREAAIELLAGSEQRRVHQAIAEALDQLSSQSLEHIYALAYHFSRGQTEKNPRRVCEACLAAGNAALTNHGYEDAYQLLKAGQEHLPAALELTTELLGGLGRACVSIGRLDEAFPFLEQALALATSQEDRFRLQHLLTLAYASQGRNQEALRSLFRTFEVLGRPYPKSPVLQLLAMSAYMCLGLILRVLGLGYGSAQGEERRRRQVLAELHYAGSMIALFEGRPILMTQFIMRDFYNAHKLGNTGESAIGYSVFGAAMGLMQLKKAQAKFARVGVEIAEQLGDRRATAVSRAYGGVGSRWVGDFQKARQTMVETLPQLQKHVPGSWYTAMMNAEVAYSNLHAGLTREAIAHIRAATPHIDRTNNLMFQYNTYAVLYSQLMVTGENGEATELWQKLEKLYEQIGHTAYARLARTENLLAVYVERGETGPEVDEIIQQYLDLHTEDYYGTAARIFVGYARLNQYLAAEAGPAKVKARQQLVAAIRALRLRAMVPLLKCNVWVWKAALARDEGRLEEAEKALKRAGALVQQCGSRMGLYYVTLERARLAKAQGDAGARMYALAALEVAVDEGWRTKEANIREEFNLAGCRGSREQGSRSHSMRVAAGSVLARPAGEGGAGGQRYADALLQISLASTSSWDPVQQAQRALAEIARVLGAERALFFMLNEATGALDLTASHRLGGKEGEEEQGYSSSVVRRVLETGEPYITSGSEDGALLGAESVMLFNLRSIIAAPLKVRDQLKGVVYLHNSLAKGMFTLEHVDLLLGFANHIAIAVETARGARLEAERRELQRDMALTGAVQEMLLPKDATFVSPGLSGAGSCEAATLCGGDWWWHAHEEGRHQTVVMGDVTGHGAPSAMVTATVSGAYQTLSRARPDASPQEVLEELHRCVRTLGSHYYMTMSIVQLDPVQSQLRLWNAGSPPIYIYRKGSRVPESVVAPGSPLGIDSGLTVGHRTVGLTPGDRLLICTDGLLEMKLSDGKLMSPRLMTRIMAELWDHPAAEARTQLRDRLATLRGLQAPDDDITFAIVDFQRERTGAVGPAAEGARSSA